ncbi:MAG TPA: ethanolamine utilization protein EutH [bacterium]|nr:ethanolamine utilization protein EutH [bacterium]HNT65247.1 ethanolamine utilization protein EutH [bacterium]HOX86950.1 ethanolamine utilization protein EutH [bacterium]HPG46281.1 ethanolamine utilization protein EutH [bacterium]HPM98525.1 ethanolamine utilization protein EutH [bacterium]
MALVNQIIINIMMAFMVLGALDRILAQFGGSENVLKKVRLGRLGRTLDGAGAQFEEGFNAMGPLALAMVGVISLAPVLARLLGPVIIPLYEFLGASPAMFATTLLANDMGGFFLAKELATTAGQIDYPAWMYAGLILGAMMGPTIVFSIPVGIGIIDRDDRKFLALGVLAGIVTIPLGCIAGGLVAMISNIQAADGSAVIFSFELILKNLIPVVIVSLLIALGLWRIPNAMIKGFLVFAKLLIALITLALASIVLETLTGLQIIPGMDPIFPIAGDQPTIDLRAMEVIGRIAIVLLGAYPMVFLLTRWFEKPLLGIGKLLKMNSTAAAGMIATLANNIPMFKIMNKMDDRGKVLNVAFAVSAAFTFGDHLGFTAANKPDMIFAVIVGKLVGGVTAVLFAMLLAPKGHRAVQEAASTQSE